MARHPDAFALVELGGTGCRRGVQGESLSCACGRARCDQWRIVSTSEWAPVRRGDEMVVVIRGDRVR